MEVKKIEIGVRHLTRVEGHGNIIVRAHDGQIDEVTWAVTESPRFFEVMLRGRPWYDAHVLASRICGICSVSHQIASIKATEAAFGLKPSEQTVLLRKLLYAGEVIESHILHIYLLALPDFLGVPSAFALMESHKDAVLCGLRLKKLGNDIMETIGGRAVHPQAAIVNGFGRLPGKEQLLSIKTRLQEALPDMAATVDLFQSLVLPDFTRETEYISLKHPDEYTFTDGDIASTDTGITSVDNYLDVTNEYCVPQSTAKYTKNARESFMVGALARINNNYEQLNPQAKEAADRLGLKPLCTNPFLNTPAQVAETTHEIEESIAIIDRLLETGIQAEDRTVKVKAGRGIGAVEAPRGLLIHDYTYDENGNIVQANCVVPTNENHANIQLDLESLVRDNLEKGPDELQLLCEMLVRAYDPCISCSTH